MKIEKTKETIQAVEKMSEELAKLGYELECSTETAQNFSLFARALHYALSGRGALFSNIVTVSATNFMGGEPMEFNTALEMRKTLRASGWAQVSSGVWKPRLREI